MRAEFTPQRDADGAVYYSIACVCGSRRTRRMGHRVYQCQTCGQTVMTFIGAEAGAYSVPLATGVSMEAERRGGGG
jgi:ribosomal protein L37AE/L43A